MAEYLKLEKYSIGVGDRFARQAKAQLQACILAARQGSDVIPVWNKSNREHLIIGSGPDSTRAAADSAVRELGWRKPYHVDADHIQLETVDRFLPHSDFYTIDVAAWIGQPAGAEAVSGFAERHPELAGSIRVPRIVGPFVISRAEVERIAARYWLAIKEAGRIYRRILQAKGEGQFITEISMDESGGAQTPLDLLIILAAIADEGIRLHTIAPKFAGRFNKGVDYVGDVARFESEFDEHLAVIGFAVERYGLPRTLKLSVHSGSDKFSIYGPIRRSLSRFDAGLHLKTAGTTWLEEVTGLAEAGGSGLALAREIYAGAFERVEELCAPYAKVLDIDLNRLPSVSVVKGWNSEQFVSALRHERRNPAFNPHLRQLLHVGYRIAADMGNRYLDALKANETAVARNVTNNLFERHIKPLFLGAADAEPSKLHSGVVAGD